MIYQSKKKKQSVFIEWAIGKLDNGRYIEMHFRYMNPKLSKLAYEDGGWSYVPRRFLNADKKLFQDRGICYTAAGGEHSDLVELPQKSAVKFYRSQAKKAHKAGWDVDVLYALFMVQYHKEGK